MSYIQNVNTKKYPLQVSADTVSNGDKRKENYQNYMDGSQKSVAKPVAPTPHKSFFKSVIASE